MKQVIKNTTIADRLLFFVLLALSIAGILITREAMPQGSDVVIEVKGKPAYTFPLHTNKTVTVNGPYGETVIEIRDKKVRIAEASCPNKLCLQEGWVSKGVLVCLPNKILVFVGGSGNTSEKGIDAVTG